MGATAGTGMGVQRFAEGGSTSSGVSTAAAHQALNQSLLTPNPAAQQAAQQAARDALAVANLGGGFGGINPAAIRVDSRAFGIGPAAQSLQRDLAREQMESQHQIYRPKYVDYGAGLEATPQARGYLGSMLGMTGDFVPRTPTFTRTSVAPQTTYKIPMGGTKRATVDPNLSIISQAVAPQQTMYDSEGNMYRPTRYMDQSQRDAILANPGAYLDYTRYVSAGNDPSTYRFKQQPISMMTAAQRDAYTNKQRQELERLLPPVTPVYDGGG